MLWGENGRNQLDVPAELATLNVVQVSAGWWNNVALTDKGRVYEWGRFGAQTPADIYAA